MPDLPTLTVTQSQADRMLAAYGSIAEYRAWLKESIIEYVLNKEQMAAVDQFRVEQDTAREQTRTELS